MNHSVSAETLAGIPRIGVHEQLHSPKIGRALGHALATNDFRRFYDEVGVLRE